MLTFIPPSVFVAKLRPSPTPIDYRRVRSVPPARTPNVASLKASAASNSADDDNTVIGNGQQAYGMLLPNLSDSDRAYLENATSNEDFMRRMTKVAHKMDQARHAESARIGRQSPDDYMEALNKSASEREAHAAVGQKKEPEPAKIDVPTSKEEVIEKSMNKIHEKLEELAGVDDPPEEEAHNTVEEVDAKIRELQRELMDAAGGSVEDETLSPGADEIASAGSLSEKELTAMAEVAELEKKIRMEVGLNPEDGTSLPQEEDAQPQPESAPSDVSSAASNANPGTVDKQIEFLENYVARLQQDAVDEGDAEKLAEDDKETKPVQDAAEDPPEEKRDVSRLVDALNKKVTTPPDGRNPTSFQGLTDTPGEMSADEKKAMFMELQRRAMEAKQGDPGMGDPFNVLLPNKRGREEVPDFSDGDEPIDNPAEYDSFGPSVGDKDFSDGDEPTGDPSEYDSFAPSGADRQAVIEEIEVEMKNYTQKSQELLKEHKARIGALVAKLLTMQISLE